MSEENKDNNPEPNTLAKISDGLNKFSKGADKVSKGANSVGKGCTQFGCGLFLLIILGFIFFSCH